MDELLVGSVAGREEVKVVPQSSSALYLQFVSGVTLNPSAPLEDFLSSGNTNKSGVHEADLKDFTRKKRCKCEYSSLLADIF